MIALPASNEFPVSYPFFFLLKIDLSETQKDERERESEIPSDGSLLKWTQ